MMKLLLLLAFACTSVGATVCTPVSEIDFAAYSGRWYNIYYDRLTQIFSSPNCATAYYAIDSSAIVPTLTVNNSGLDRDGKTSTFLRGYVAQNDATQPSDLTLHLDGVSQDASYRICALGDKTYGAGYYQWSVVTDDAGLSLYVLARDVNTFFSTYDSTVTSLLNTLGYTGLIFGPVANNQAGCPSDIYSPAWNVNTPLAKTAPAKAVPAPSASNCPGGELSTCMGLCPSTPADAYKACVGSCATRCSTMK